MNYIDVMNTFSFTVLCLIAWKLDMIHFELKKRKP
jgi:hypothetical protein